MIYPEVGQTHLGNSDLEVSTVGFGTYKLGIKPSASEALDLLGHAFDAGVNLFDTSDNYPGAEMLLARAIADGTLPRDDIVISDKTGFAGPEYEHYEFVARGVRQDLSPERIRRKVDDSLRVLGVDEIDLYQVHVYDPAVEPIAIVRVMNDLIGLGKIRHWGVSNYNNAQDLVDIYEAAKDADLQGPITLQNGYNVFNARNSWAVPVARDLGMTVLAFSPLQRGAVSERLFEAVPHFRELAGMSIDEPDLTDEVREDIEHARQQLPVIEGLRPMQAYGDELGANMQRLAIAWLMHQPATIPLLGTYKQEHFDDLIQAVDLQIPQEGLALIERIAGSIS